MLKFKKHMSLVPLSGRFSNADFRVVTIDGVPCASALDLLDLCGYERPSETFRQHRKADKEIQERTHYAEFSRVKTPFLDARGFVLLLNRLDSALAKEFRAASAEVVVRYLGGDTTLAKEVHAMRDAQQQLPEGHVGRLFGETVEAGKPDQVCCFLSCCKPSRIAAT